MSDDRYKEVTCTCCRRTYICSPTDDYYAPAEELDWTAGKVCERCLLVLAGRTRMFAL